MQEERLRAFATFKPFPFLVGQEAQHKRVDKGYRTRLLGRVKSSTPSPGIRENVLRMDLVFHKVFAHVFFARVVPDGPPQHMQLVHIQCMSSIDGKMQLSTKESLVGGLRVCKFCFECAPIDLHSKVFLQVFGGCKLPNSNRQQKNGGMPGANVGAHEL